MILKSIAGFVFLPAAAGQTVTGTLQGTVSDSRGAGADGGAVNYSGGERRGTSALDSGAKKNAVETRQRFAALRLCERDLLGRGLVNQPKPLYKWLANSKQNLFCQFKILPMLVAILCRRFSDLNHTRARSL